MAAKTMWERNDGRGGQEKAERRADADRNGDRRGDKHAEEYGNVACEGEGHGAEHDARHEHRNNDAYGAQYAGEYHVVQATAFHHWKNSLSVILLTGKSIPQNLAPVKTPVNNL